MANNKDLDTSVYVDFSALNEWRNEMDRINGDALSTLDSFESTIGELNNYWSGNSASGFLSSSKNLVNKARSYHNDMCNVEDFLIKVIETMDNQ